MHDAAYLADSFAPHRDHVAPLAHGDRHVRRAVVGLERAHHALENAHQLSVGRTQLAPDPAQRGRRLVADRAVLANGALDGLLFRLRDHHPVDERSEHRA